MLQQNHSFRVSFNLFSATLRAKWEDATRRSTK